MKVILFIAMLVMLNFPSGESLTCYHCNNLVDPKCYSEPTIQETFVCGSAQSHLQNGFNAWLILDEGVHNLTKYIEKNDELEAWKPIVALLENKTPPTSNQWPEAWMKTAGNMRRDGTPKAWRDFFTRAENIFSQPKVIEAFEKVYSTTKDVQQPEEISKKEKDIVEMNEILEEVKESFKPMDETVRNETIQAFAEALLKLNASMTTEGLPTISRKRRETDKTFICYKKVKDSTQVYRGCMEASEKCDKEDGCFSCDSDNCN